MEMTMADPVPPDAREELSTGLESEEALAHLTLAWRPSPPKYKVQLVELSDDVSKTFLDLARRAGAQLAQRVKLAYDPEWPLRDYEYFELEERELPGENLFAELADFQNLDVFKKRRLTKPRLYIVAVQTPHGTAFLGKRMAYLKVLRQTPGLIATVWDGSTFTALTDSVATFSTAFDWILWDKSLYVLDTAAFHAEFRDVAALRKAVAEHVASISEYLTIQHADMLTERCQSNVAMASKLKRVAEHGLHLTSSIADLKRYASEYEIQLTWDGDELLFEGSLEGQWAILKLLDEDRTEGPVSHRHYESAAKREIA
jgi:Domain of unknown function (DUF4868)